MARRPVVTSAMGKPSMRGYGGEPHAFTYRREQDDGQAPAKAGCGSLNDRLHQVVTFVDVDDGHAQDGAVGRDQRKVDAQGLMQSGLFFFRNISMNWTSAAITRMKETVCR